MPFVIIYALIKSLTSIFLFCFLRVEAQDLSELRRMTCPVGGLYGECPNLKALAVSCRQANQLYLSANDVHSGLRRHSDDVDGRGRAYWLRLAKSHLIGGYQTLKARLSPSRDLEFLDEGRRCLSVEFASARSAAKRKCKSSEDVSTSTKEDLKHPQRNMSSSLVIHSLKEGRLCAEISLGDHATDDDVIVRIRNYTLDILMQKKSTGKKSSGKSSKENLSPDRQPYKLGAVDIPIYLDPETLCFDLVDNHTLIMEGETKSCMPRRVCHSQDDMDKLPRSRSPFERRKSSTTWYVNSQSERPGFFRQRSYTQ